MIILWKNNILWWRTNKSWRFKLDDDENFFLGKLIVASLFDLTLLVLFVEIPYHGLKA